MSFLLLVLACNPPAPIADATQRPVSIRFVAMNDFHGALYERPLPDQAEATAGGLPWLVGAIDALRLEDPDLVLLDGGDCFQGDWPINASKGHGSVQAFDLMDVDAAAIGNHEFDYGQGSSDSHPLRGALEQAASTQDRWLVANIYAGDERWSPPGVRPWAIVERKGVRIGVLGLTTTETPQTTLRKNVEDLQFADPVATVREMVPELRAAGADVVVVVGHLTGKCEPRGLFEPAEVCNPDGEIGRLLTELPPGTIDVLVAGHAHTLMAARVGETFVLENRSHGTALGLLDLVVGPDGVDVEASKLHAPWPIVHSPTDPGCEGGTFPLEPRSLGARTVTPSASAVALVAELEAAAGSLCEPITCADAPLTRDRHSESAVGDVVADALRAAFPDSDFAVQNSGGLRADLPAGTLRREHVHSVMPFENRTLLVEMTGAQVLELFRIGSSGAHGVLQVSGATYSYDPALSAGADRDGDGTNADWERDRLCSVTVGGKPVDEARTYRVVTSDFLFGGGDHLGPAFAGATIVREGPLLRDVILDRLRAQQGCIGPAIVRPEQPRIRNASCSN